MPIHTTTVTLSIDLEALREQKLTLLEMIESHPDVSEDLTGILNLIDAIQDQEEEEVGSRTVFGK